MINARTGDPAFRAPFTLLGRAGLQPMPLGKNAADRRNIQAVWRVKLAIFPICDGGDVNGLPDRSDRRHNGHCLSSSACGERPQMVEQPAGGIGGPASATVKRSKLVDDLDNGARQPISWKGRGTTGSPEISLLASS